MAKAVFVDTWAFLALINRDDAWHADAVDVAGRLAKDGVRLVTTEWVLAEFLGSAARPPFRHAAIRAVSQFRSSPGATVVAASHDDWESGFQLYEGRPDKEWSFVDCLSMRICERLGISQVFTGDHHFKQGGFETLISVR